MDETADSADPANIATAALLMADPQADLQRAVALAEMPPPPWLQERNDNWTRVSRALAAYRTERYGDAIRLALVDRDRKPLGKPYEAQMFLNEAVARAQLGEREEARDVLRQAKALLSPHLIGTQRFSGKIIFNELFPSEIALPKVDGRIQVLGQRILKTKL